MILHMGGTFGDKEATLDRFRENYARLSPSVKNRLVLENDDMCWSVHDLLPICKELNIPFVLDFHHHNIIFDSDKIREGTKDIMELFPEILETWRRKKITPKMHYSEQTSKAITSQQRRKHSPRVSTLPPCPDDMDLMIEAKDKEQAVFELMKNFRLSGFEKIHDIIPYVRNDENKPVKPPTKKSLAKKASKKKVKTEDADDALEAVGEDLDEQAIPVIVPDEEIGMGGPEGRVYWPLGMEEWLRPKKREVKKKEPGVAKPTPTKKTKEQKKPNSSDPVSQSPVPKEIKSKKTAKTTKSRKEPARKLEAVPTPSTSDGEEDDKMFDLGSEENYAPELPVKVVRKASARKSARTGRVSYREEDVSDV